MSYEEKGQWVYVVANILTFFAYVAIIMDKPRRRRWLTSTTSRRCCWRSASALRSPSPVES